MLLDIQITDDKVKVSGDSFSYELPLPSQATSDSPLDTFTLAHQRIICEDVDSQAIQLITYDTATWTIGVKFHNGGTSTSNDDVLYLYKGHSLATFLNFKKALNFKGATSLHDFWTHNIRGDTSEKEKVSYDSYRKSAIVEYT